MGQPCQRAGRNAPATGTRGRSQGRLECSWGQRAKAASVYTPPYPESQSLLSWHPVLSSIRLSSVPSRTPTPAPQLGFLGSLLRHPCFCGVRDPSHGRHPVDTPDNVRRALSIASLCPSSLGPPHILKFKFKKSFTSGAEEGCP